MKYTKLLGILFLSQTVFASENVLKLKIVAPKLKEKINKNFLFFVKNSTTDNYELSNDSLKFFSGGQKNSLLKAVNMLPSVDYQGTFSGISGALPHSTGIKIRGISFIRRPGSVLNIENIPTPGGLKFDQNVININNVDSVKLYEGAVPPDEVFSMDNFGGLLNLIIKKPKDNFNVFLLGGGGIHDFNQLFLRIDSGNLNGFKTFISSYYSYVNKWKGEGNAVNKNIMFGVNKKLSNIVNIELYALHNQDHYNMYAPLDYSKAVNINSYYDYDYNNNPNDPGYYGYNKVKINQNFILSKITIAPQKDTTFVLEPYYWHIDGFQMGKGVFVPANYIGNLIMNTNNYGAVFKYKQKFFKNYELITGYFYHEEGKPGPPNFVEKYTVVNGTLKDLGPALRSDNNYNRITYPFLVLKYDYNNFLFEIGGKYLSYNLAEQLLYNNDGTIDPKASAGSRSYYKFLPYAGVNYENK